MSLYEVIIPWRDRGIDPLRAQNLSAVMDRWDSYGMSPIVIGDRRCGDEQFNRSAAYNRGVKAAFGDADGFIFAESDMLIDVDQIDEACEEADRIPGMVVPFTQYRYLGPGDSQTVRENGVDPATCQPQWTMDDGRSIGAINVVSRKTMELVGQFDEKFEGNWYDDDATKLAFDMLAGPTRFIDGPAHHLYHLPGHRGAHLTPEDKAATRRNRIRWSAYQQAARFGDVDRIRQLLGGSR